MTMATDPVDERALVGIPQIADIANVGRSAVGNWRKRHSDFPTPKVQTPSGALFDLREVEDWLIEQGKISQRAPASARLWAMADAARGVWMPDDFVRFSVAFLIYLEACARARGEGPSGLDLQRPRIPAGATWSDVRSQPPAEFMRTLIEAARNIEAVNPELDGLLDPRLDEQDAATNNLAHQVAITLDAAAGEEATRFALFEGLADLESFDRFSGEYSTPADVARLVADLVDFRGGTVLDPAVGEGRLLWQTAFERPSITHPPAADAHIVGIDINHEAVRRSRSRFYLYGRRAEIRDENALMADPDSLPLADVVVLDPPYGLGNWGHAELYVDPRWQFGSPPPSSADFAWLQLAALKLKPTGRAAVVMGTGSLFRGGREGAIRRRLVEAGVVEAIVALPPRLRTNTSIPLAVWLLRSPAAPTNAEEILLVDASGLGATGRSQYSLPQPGIDRIVNVVNRWRQAKEISEEDADIAVSVAIADILATEVNLSPARYRERPQVDLRAIEEQAEALRRSLQESSAEASKAYTELLTYLESRT
jgi:type I restriction-modification system DNA methylase subunit